jgi:trimethylamine--corrinoid protein Co-methyltransferase
LRHKHTRKFFKTEFWYPNLCDRHNYEEWSAAGSLPMRDRVVARVRNILATHTPPPLKPETEKVIREVIEKAEDRVKNPPKKAKRD